jgi:hypothetical protein
MRKARKSVSPPLSVKLPSKSIREKILVKYELEGCQKAVNYLTAHYEVRKMKVVLDGRKVGKSCLACYFENHAYFKVEGLNRRIILHELYHHLVESRNLEMPLRTEEKEANYFAERSP